MYAVKSPMPQVISNTTVTSLWTSPSSVLVTRVLLKLRTWFLYFLIFSALKHEGEGLCPAKFSFGGSKPQ